MTIILNEKELSLEMFKSMTKKRNKFKLKGNFEVSVNLKVKHENTTYDQLYDYEKAEIPQVDFNKIEKYFDQNGDIFMKTVYEIEYNEKYDGFIIKNKIPYWKTNFSTLVDMQISTRLDNIISITIQ